MSGSFINATPTSPPRPLHSNVLFFQIIQINLLLCLIKLDDMNKYGGGHVVKLHAFFISSLDEGDYSASHPCRFTPEGGIRYRFDSRYDVGKEKCLRLLEITPLDGIDSYPSRRGHNTVFARVICASAYFANPNF